MTTLALDQNTFDTEVAGSNLVLVDFWASWCGPCKAIAPALEELAEELADVALIAKVDVDANAELARRYDVMSVPTMLVFRNGELASRHVGAMSKDNIRSTLTRTA